MDRSQPPRSGEEARCGARAPSQGRPCRARARRRPSRRPTLPPTARVSRLSRDRVGHRRRIAAGGSKTYVRLITTQPPIVRRESAGKTSRWMVCICTGGHVMAIAPTLQRYLAAENIQYEEILHELSMSSSRTAEACHISGDRLAKGIVLRRDGEYMLAVMPASHHLRLSELRTRLGDNVDMADETEINQLFRDCAHGAVPAVGKCYGLD